MAAEHPIPADHVEAFRQSVALFGRNWPWENEPQRQMDGRYWPITSIFNFISIYDDEIPEQIREELLKVGIDPNWLPDIKFSTAANYLLREHQRRTAERDRNRDLLKG